MHSLPNGALRVEDEWDGVEPTGGWADRQIFSKSAFGAADWKKEYSTSPYRHGSPYPQMGIRE